MMKTKFSLLAVFVIVSMLLTACSISIITKVNADGTGELGFAYKFTKDDLSALSGYGMSGDTICTDMQTQGSGTMPEDFVFKQEKHGDETWCVGAKKFDNLDDLKTEISGEGFTINTMEINDGKFVFDAVADMSSTDTTEMPLSITINYDLTAPGKIDKVKSDKEAKDLVKIDGNTMSWTLSLSKSTSMHLESSTTGGGGGGGGGGFSFKWWYGAILACCCLLILIIVGVVVFFVMKKKPKQPRM